MSSEAMHWYPSKVDWWIALVLCLPPLASLAVLIALLSVGAGSEWVWAIVPVLIVVAVYVGLILPIRYGLDDTQLLVRFGLCRQRVALSDISEVRPTHNPLSSPALSFDRLHVQYGQGVFKAVIISPADRNRFLDELAQKAGLRRDGDRLVRG